MQKINFKKNELPKTNKDECISILSEEEVKKALEFHKSFPTYEITPLRSLSLLADEIGVKNIFVKDESYRFGLNAFKVLGGSYAMGRYISDKLGEDIKDLPYDKLVSKDTKDKVGDITFFTATDGNHGRGVAYSANILNQKSVVYMPKGSSITRLDNIKKEGAEASITDMNYDDAVRLAYSESLKVDNGIIVQDTAWEGYVDIPTWIMQGYGTMAYEALNQLTEYGTKRPTHIFVQAGVGSLAGAIQGFFASYFKGNPPIVVVCESDLCDCLYKGAVANDGDIRTVGGDMQTIMAGLACGEPNILGWEILKNHTTAFASVPDYVAAKAMRIYAAPKKGDPQVISGESGAVTLGVLYEIMTNPEYKEVKEMLELDNTSEVLLFSTEGDTDPIKYKEIVWDGDQYK